MDAPAPWERQPGEPARAYAAFCIYRDLPPSERSLRAVADRLYGVKPDAKRRRVPGQIHQWSTRWRWVERAAAWDDEQDRRAREAQLRAVREMRERHIREAMALQQKALQRLQSMDLSELSPADTLRFIVEAAKLERLSRGEPDSIQEQRNDWVAAVLQAWARRSRRSRAADVNTEGDED